MSTLEIYNTVNDQFSNLAAKSKHQTDLQMFIDKYQPSKFKQLKNGIEIRSVSDVQGAAVKATELIKSLKLRLVVVSTAEMAAYKAFEVREVQNGKS